MSGWIVAWAFKGTDDWQVIAGHANKPDAKTMRQYRQGFRSRRVRMFSEAKWQAERCGR